MMRIVIAGGSGMVGRRLTSGWLSAGHEVAVLTRDPERTRRRIQPGVAVHGWDPRVADDRLVDALTRADAVVNLAGTSLGGPPWTPARKRAIRESRLDATTTIVEAIGRLPTPDRPAVLVNASGIDVYGDRPDETVTEASEPGDSFLARLVVAWEGAAESARNLGVRVVLARTSLIVAREAPAWRLVMLPFRLFVGGPLGSGRQRFTWIHLEDVAGLYELAVRDASIEGPMNLVAPDVPTQRGLAKAIGRAIHRPAALSIPSALLRLVLWGQADLLLHGRNAIAVQATEAGYQFTFPTLESALADVTSRR
jgi:uncharacterized protein (TIGR01777 family)